MDQFLRFWHERAPREKVLLGLAAGVLLLAVVYLIFIEPAATGIARLERGLPQARANAAQLDALITEVKSLKGRAQVATMSAAEARSSIEKSLAAAGIKASRVVPLSSGDIQMTFTNVPYAGWSVWLANAERELGARTITVTANSTTTPGNVDVELALRLASR